MRKRLFTLLLALPLLVGVAACGDDDETTDAGGTSTSVASDGTGADASSDEGNATGVSDDVIKIGVYSDLSGAYAAVFESYAVGVEAAVEAINDGGGVGGRTLELERYDSASDPTRSVTEMRRADSDGVFALLVGSQFVDSALPLAAEVGIPLVGWGVSPNWAGPESFFPYSGTRATSQTDASLRYLAEEGITKVAMLSGPEASVVLPLFEDAANALDLEVVYKNDQVPASGGDAAAVTLEVQRIKDSGAEAVLSIMGLNQALITAADQEGLDADILIFTGYDDQFAQAVGEAMTGVTVAIDFTPKEETSNEGVAMFNQVMDAAGVTATDYTQIGYIVTELFRAGVEAAGEDLSRESFIEAMNGPVRDEFTGGGIIQPLTTFDWHTQGVPCLAFVQWTGSAWEQVGEKPFVCGELLSFS